MTTNLEIYDRQSRTYGLDGTIKILNAYTIIFGQKSDLLFEVAKNLILSGINKIAIVKDHNLEVDFAINSTLFDKNSFEISLDDSEEQFFGNIHNITYNRIKSELNILNPDCNISLLGIDEDYNKDAYKNATMIFINHNPIRVMALNEQFRDHNKFIVITVYDNTVEIINDFNNHLITDIDGENYDRCVVIDLNIEDNKIIIKTANKHNLSRRDTLKLILNDNEYITTVSNIVNKNVFVIPFIDNIHYVQGYIQRVKDTMLLNHTSIRNHYKENFENLIDTSKLNPIIQAFVGSIITSECIKSITHKYMPFNQVQTFEWSQELYFRPSIETIHKLNKLKYFIVGCGAIGCELLKNLASIGVRNIEITDPDHIELSNLSRQFLFHKDDIHKSKSQTASNKIMKFNTDLNVVPFIEKLDANNLKFVDEHFNKANIIFNALDNLQGRLFVDANCIKYSKPLFESGTMGNSGNTQPIIPNITESYGASKDPEGETNYAVCTIKHFPSLIQHTIHFAMEDFTNLFNKEPTDLIKIFLGKPSNKPSNIHNSIIHMLNKIKSIDDYIEWAFCLFYDRFIRRINKILDAHPLDSKEGGVLFWSNGKRPPNGAISKELFNDYMLATTYLLINTYNLSDIKYNVDIILSYNYDAIDVNQHIDDPDHNNVFPNIIFNKLITINPQQFEKDNDDNRHIAYIHACSNIRASIYNIPNATFFETKGIAGKIIPALATTTSAIASLITLEMLKYVININRPITDYKSYFINLATNFFIDGEPNPPKKVVINNIHFNEWTKFTFNSDFILEHFVKHLSDVFKTDITMIMLNTKTLFSDSNITNIKKSLKQILLENNINSKECTLSIGSSDDMLELPDITVLN